MGIFDEENFIEIAPDDMADAEIVSKNVPDKDRKRAFANILGARLGIKYLNSLGIKSDNYSSIYTIPSVLRDIDISDILTSNGIKIDIRLVKDSESLCVPKTHYDYNITPDIYIFIVPAKDFMSADFAGAIAPDEVDKSVTDGKYYFVANNTVYNEQSLKAAVTNGKTRTYQKPTENEIIKAQGLVLNFIDGDILQGDKIYLYDILKRSSEFKVFFKDFEHFEYISHRLATTEEVLNDSVLDILGAQELYKDKDGTIGSDINLDELSEITAADFIEEFIDENEEDNNMSENDIIEGDFEEINDTEELNEDDNVGLLEELPTDKELAEFETIDSFDDSNESDEEQEITSELVDFEEISSLTNTSDSSELSMLEDVQEEGLVNFDTISDFDDNDDKILTENNALEDITEINAIDNAEEFAESSTEILEDLNLHDDEQDTDLEQFESIESTSEELPEQDDDDLLLANDDKELDDFEELTLDLNSDSDVNDILKEADDISYENNIISNDETEMSEFVGITDNEDNIQETELISEDLSLEEISDNNDLIDNEINLDDFSIAEDSIETEETDDLSILSDDITEENTDDIENIDNKENSIENEEPEKTSSNEDISLETSPIDLTLPELVPDGDLPFFEEFQEETTEDIKTANDAENIIQDELSEPSSDNSAVENLSVENDNTDNELTLDNISEDINLDNITEDTPQVSDTLDELDFAPLEELQSDSEIEELKEVTETEPEPEPKTDNSQNDDMSGLEEFTMDMAEATEKANPNLLNPNFASDIQETDSPSIDLEAFQFSSNDEPEEQAELELVNDEPELKLVSDDETPQEPVENNSAMNMDDINLDEFDIDSDSTSTGDTELGNESIDGIDIDNINIDDIDMNNINLDEFDLNDEFQSTENSMPQSNTAAQANTLADIPEIPPAEGSGYEYTNEQQYTNEPNSEAVQQNAYIPDFDGNDKNTIETLYQDNAQSQNSDDALDNAFDQNQVNAPQKPKNKAGKQKKASPILGIALLALVCAFGYIKKDFIISKINETRGITEQQDQNMPIEGETTEDKEDQELLEDNSQSEEGQEEDKQGIGAIPGEAGGPQDAAAMEASLKQGKSKIDKLPDSSYAKTPEPLSSSDIKKLSWEIPQELTYNESIVNYLKTVGKTMKFAIQSDLLNTTELPYSNKMIINIDIKKDGNIDNVKTAVSSGSKQIDSIVLQTVNAALKYVKAPTSEFKNDSYTFSLIINF